MNIKNIFNFFKRSNPTNPQILPTEYVVFDGDQTTIKLFRKLFRKLYRKSNTTIYEWATCTSVPKNVDAVKDITIKKTTSYGKESTDNLIAMSIVDNLHKHKSIQKVFIASSDCDFVDTVLNLSIMFPSVKFVIIRSQTQRMIGKAQTGRINLNTLNPNCSTIRVKI